MSANPALLRVATYNVHKCRGLDGRLRPDRIAKVLRAVDADIVALQEVIGSAGSEATGQAQGLARELGMSFAFGENRKHGGESYGNAILSRRPLVWRHNLDLTVAGREERGCLCADIEIGGATLHLFNLHLGTAFFERREQARMLITPELMRAERLKGPRIVLGDFNEWTRGLVSQVLAGEFRSADIRLRLKQRRTYPGILPFLHVDHIYYDEALQLESVRLHRSRLALVASDHLPLVAEFRLKTESDGTVVSS